MRLRERIVHRLAGHRDRATTSNDPDIESAYRRDLKRRYRELDIPPLTYVWPISDDVHAFETEDGRRGWINFRTLEHDWAQDQ